MGSFFSFKRHFMNKLTKIVATIGPSSEDPDMLRALLLSGVDVVRFNLKHNEIPWHATLVDTVKKIAKEEELSIGTLIDLQGPEVRTRVFVNDGEIPLKIGDKVILSTEKEPKSQNTFTVTQPEVLDYLEKEQKVVVDDGRLHFIVDTPGKNKVTLISLSDGVLKNRKTMNVPGALFPLQVLNEKDIEAIEMAASHHVDYIALSFVRTAEDILTLKKMMEEKGVDARVISKIETQSALDNIDEIVAASEGIMVARGDLGVEIPMEQVPFYQKEIIKKCLERGIPVITATQMLHSMIDRSYPTRAEVSDIANAAYDFTDAVMLSEETAAGKYPLEAVKTQAQTVAFSEKRVAITDTRSLYDYLIRGCEEMLCDSAYNMVLQLHYQDQPIGGFIVFTQTGRTARKLSRYRPKYPIYVFAPDKKVRDQLALNFGTYAFLQPKIFKENTSVRVPQMTDAIEFLRKRGLVESDKHYILLYGDSWMVAGGTSSIKIIPPQE